MSRLFDDLTASLNELKEHAEGKPTGVIIHRRSSTTVIDVPEFTPQEKPVFLLDECANRWRTAEKSVV